MVAEALDIAILLPLRPPAIGRRSTEFSYARRNLEIAATALPMRTSGVNGWLNGKNAQERCSLTRCGPSAIARAADVLEEPRRRRGQPTACYGEPMPEAAHVIIGRKASLQTQSSRAEFTVAPLLARQSDPQKQRPVDLRLAKEESHGEHSRTPPTGCDFKCLHDRRPWPNLPAAVQHSGRICLSELLTAGPAVADRRLQRYAGSDRATVIPTGLPWSWGQHGPIDRARHSDGLLLRNRVAPGQPLYRAQGRLGLWRRHHRQHLVVCDLDKPAQIRLARWFGDTHRGRKHHRPHRAQRRRFDRSAAFAAKRRYRKDRSGRVEAKPRGSRKIERFRNAASADAPAKGCLVPAAVGTSRY